MRTKLLKSGSELNKQATISSKNTLCIVASFLFEKKIKICVSQLGT